MSFANSFSRNLLIDWIKICLNNSSQPNKERFFQWKQIIKCVWSLHYRVFSMLIATNLSAILSSEKHSENTKCPKKKQITVIKPKDFPNEKNSHLLVYYKIVILKNSKDFDKNIRGTMLPLILLTKTLHHGCFLVNFLKYLTGAVITNL